MLIGLQDWIHLLVLPFEIKKREEELELVKIFGTENFKSAVSGFEAN